MRQFKKKLVEKVEMTEKNKSTLSLVSSSPSPSQTTPNSTLTSIPTSIPSNSLTERKLFCYRKVNELFQNNSLSMFHLIQGVLDIITSGIEAQGGSLWIVEKEKIICKVAIGPGHEKIVGLELEIGQGIVGWVVQNRKSQIVYDTSVDIRFNNKKTKDTTTKTLIASPLLYSGEIIGVVEVVNKKNESELYGDDDKFFLEDLATFMAMHIKTSRVLKEQTKLIKRLENFSDLHEKFSSTLDLDELLVLVLARAIDLLQAEVGSIWLVEESGEGVECTYASGPTKDKVQGIKLKKGVGIIGNIINDKKGIIVEDCTKNKNFSQAVDQKINFTTRSMVAAPFVIKDECIGAVQIINKKGNGYFQEEDLDLLQLFGASSAMYIKNARLFAAEKKVKDLGALIDISKQITSTLDVDSVLLNIVNLSSKIIPFEVAYFSTRKLTQENTLILSAISGQQEIDFSDRKNIVIHEIHQSLIKRKEHQIYLKKEAEYAEIKDVQHLKKYREEWNLQSFWATVLKDDQGIVGVFSIESSQEHAFNKDHLELLDILVSQATVALRNAELYNTIPSSQYVKSLLDQFTSKIQTLHLLTLKQKLLLCASLVATVLSLIFVKIPNNISANIEVLTLPIVSYSEVDGNVKKIHVRTGDAIKKDQLLLEVDVEDAKIQLLEKSAKRQKAKTEMVKFLSEKNIVDFKIKESEFLSLDYEVENLQNKIDHAQVRAAESGVVLSDDLDALLGRPINFGSELIKISSSDKLIVQFQIPEKDIQYVRPEMEVKFKIYGDPQSSFDNLKLISVSGEGRQVL